MAEAHNVLRRSEEAAHQLSQMQGVGVPFPVRRLSQPRVMYRAAELSDLDDATVLARFGFVASRKVLPGTLARETATAIAERYGGPGILSNGGGARCGIVNGVQIKGIGPNPTGGRDVDYWYSHGCMTMEEAVREAVWSEVLNQFLPHGVVRVLGIIDCGMQAPARGSDGVAWRPRALMLREVVARPAHFDRAVSFRPRRRFEPILVHDAERVRNAHLSFAQVFQHANDTEASFTKQMLLATFVARWTRQLAATRARRVMHGGLSPSNTAVDGRWLDFGSVSALPTYANTKNFSPGFWGDEMLFKSLISRLCYYSNKYGPEQVSVDELMQLFDNELERATALEFIALTGIPLSVLDRVAATHPDLVDRAGRAVAGAAFRLTQGMYADDISELMSPHALRFRALMLSLPACFAGSSQAPSPFLLPDSAFRHYFLETMNMLASTADACAVADGIPQLHFRRLVFLNALKAHAVVHELFEPNLSKNLPAQVDRALASEEAGKQVAAFIASLAYAAAPTMCRPSGYLSHLGLNGHQITFDARTGWFHVGESQGVVAWGNGVNEGGFLGRYLLSNESPSTWGLQCA